jgi:uncharacterized NAD-dependent epimerase/dehydratase family protein
VAKVRFAPGQVPVAPAPAAVPEAAVPSEEQRLLAAALAAGISDEKLRESVQKAVSLGLARGAADRPF